MLLLNVFLPGVQSVLGFSHLGVQPHFCTATPLHCDSADEVLCKAEAEAVKWGKRWLHAIKCGLPAAYGELQVCTQPRGVAAMHANNTSRKCRCRMDISASLHATNRAACMMSSYFKWLPLLCPAERSPWCCFNYATQVTPLAAAIRWDAAKHDS